MLKIAAALLAFGCSYTTIATAQENRLVIGLVQFPPSLHPNVDSATVRDYITGFTIRPITAFGPDWKNTCQLCTELPTIENGLAKYEDLPGGKRGMAVTIKLKPDLRWSDGEPLTARDLAFTWKLAQDPASGMSNLNAWSRAYKVDVVDDQTAVLHLDRVRNDYNQWDHILPEHIESKVEGDYVKNTTFNRAPTTPGLADGPYMVTSYESGSRIVLEANPYWSGKKPELKQIIFRFVENTAALQANLLSGGVDMIPGEGIGLTIDQVLALQKQYPDRFAYVYRESPNYEHIDLKKENPILADKRVRHALLKALDRQTLVTRLFEGKQPVAATWVSPLNPNFDSGIATVPFDRAGAKALLAESGWKPGADGICRNSSGEKLSVEFTTTAGNRLRELQQQVLQSNWRDACIEIIIKNEPPRTVFGETLKRRTYNGMVMYGWNNNVTESPRRTLHSSQIPSAANGFAGTNYIAFDNKRMDELIEAAETELDAGKQKAIWAEMQKIYADELPVLPLFHRAEAHIVPKWLTGFKPTGLLDLVTYGAENWGRH